MNERLKEIEKIESLAEKIPMPLIELTRCLLREGICYLEPGNVLAVEKNKLKNPSAKRAALFLFTKELIRLDKAPDVLPTLRGIIQESSPLKKGEYLAWTTIGEKEGEGWYWGPRGCGRMRIPKENN